MWNLREELVAERILPECDRGRSVAGGGRGQEGFLKEETFTQTKSGGAAPDTP